MSDTFSAVIGQSSVKRKLNFLLANYRANHILPPIIFVAPKGQGKTLLSKSLARNLVQTDHKPKTFVEINCSTIVNLTQFFNQVIVPYVVDKEVTVFLDEASELPRDVEMSLLTILNPNPEHRNTFANQDFVVDFDLRKVSWIFATSEIHSVFEPLVDRLERVDLEEYTHDQLGEIILKNLKEYKVNNRALDCISSVLRGNGREAQKMADKIRFYLQARNKISVEMSDWEFLRRELSILPLGLNINELTVLKKLKERPETSLTTLASKTGFSRAALQQNIEMYLLKNNLVEVRLRGRSLTPEGRKYLKSLEIA